MGASSGGIEPGRVAEIIAGRRRGSGYRIGQMTVLTAAHVIEDDAAPVVRFDADQPGEWSVTASSRWADATSDLAVLTIPALDHAPPVEAVRFGGLGDRDAVVEARAMGFPLFKLKNYDGTEVEARQVKERYRDSHQAIGSIAVLSNRRQGTLELTVAPPGPDPDPTVSPWQGMSGAAVWVGDQIVGVISEHHRSDGLGRLAAARLDVGLDRLDSAGKAQLRELVELPEHGWQLRDVIPAEPAEVITSAYRELVADIAPDQLVGREDELGELVRFCAGDTPYAWWQAGPWAGKSALMSWLVLDPPAGVDVVSFFVTGRLSGESDSAAFAAALIGQLAALAGESPAGLLTGAGQRGQLLALLKTVAERSQQAHRRLLVVVDGLDEDTSTRAGRRSIASLLPRRPPPEVRVLVASRPHPPIPDDVPGDHPLRNVRPRPLAQSPYARDLELQAKHELQELLAGSSLQQDVLGYITASGGGLTLPDLEQLTKRAPFELNSLLGGVFGRSVKSRGGYPGIHRTGERVYLFAHETLRTIAEQQFGGTVAGYRDRIHRWADGYRERGWPPDTPAYLMRGYSRMLTSTNDVIRLTDCATDTARHDWMLHHTGGDHLALTEIAAAQDLNLRKADVDLEIALRLAFQRDQLTQRNANIPVHMPTVWSRLGETTRAEALAHAITDPYQQAEALSALAQAVAATGEHDRARRLLSEAEDLARAITNPYRKAKAFSALAQAVAATGEFDRAEDVARAITNPYWKAKALSALAQAVAATGEFDRAKDLARAITDPYWKAEALSALAQAVAATGEFDRAKDLARAITDPYWKAEALSAVAQAAAATGEFDRAKDLARAITDPYQQPEALSALAQAVAATGEFDRAEDLARAITDPDWKAEALSALAQAVAATGEFDRAEDLARAITDPCWKAEALSALAQAAAATGEHDRARRLLPEAEDLARAITNEPEQAKALSTLAQAAAATGEHDRARRLLPEAEDLARAIANPYQQAEALSALAQAVAATGEFDRAEDLARAITDPCWKAEVLSALAQAAAATGEHDRARRLLSEAEHLARAITNEPEQAKALSALAQAVAATGEHDWARRLLPEAEDLARAIANPDQQAEALSALAQAVAATGEFDRAEDLARAITDPYQQAEALSALAQAVAATGEFDRAEDLARAITDPDWKAEALSALAQAAAATGEHDRARRLLREAEDLARAITDPDWKAEALSALAQAAAATGEHDRARRLLREAEDLARAITDPDRKAEALSALAQAAAATGEFDRAEDLARAITDPDQQAEALSALAQAAAATGEHDRARRLLPEAEDLARAITDPDQQAKALIMLAELRIRESVGLAAASNLLKARRCVAEALATSSWDISVGTVARLDPLAFRRAVNHASTHKLFTISPNW